MRVGTDITGGGGRADHKKTGDSEMGGDGDSGRSKLWRRQSAGERRRSTVGRKFSGGRRYIGTGGLRIKRGNGEIAIRP